MANAFGFYMENIYLEKDGEQFGPYSMDQVARYVSDGNFSVTDFAWVEGMADWVTIHSLLINAPDSIHPGITQDESNTNEPSGHGSSKFDQLSPPRIQSQAIPRFDVWEFDVLKAYYLCSSKLNTIGFVLFIINVILGIVTLAAFHSESDSEKNVKLILVSITLFYLLTFTGIVLRTKWGQIFGIIAFVPLIGVAYGLWAISVLHGASELFGSQRIKHKDIVSEYKRLKKLKKLKKKIDRRMKKHIA